MPALTRALFPAQVDGAVTLQAALDAREGDRLPLEVALYIAAELATHVAELNALGKGVGAIDPSRVWCTRQGAVWVPETADPKADGAGLGGLVYRLLSGAAEVTAWPPSYFNPAVDSSLDAAVMDAVNGEGPKDAKAMVEAVKAACKQLVPAASIEGMARLVLAVPDEEVPPPPKRAPRPPTQVELPAVVAPHRWLKEQAAPLSVALLVLLFVGMIFTTATHREAPAIAEAPVAAVLALPLGMLESIAARANVCAVRASAPKGAAVAKKSRHR